MTTTRRVFLQVLSAGGVLAACGGTIGCPTAPPTTVDELPDGLTFAGDGSSVILGKDAGGVYAMSSICTHAGCDMTQQGGIRGAEVDCYCHSSTFDAAGNAVGGPAFRPLQHFKVTIAADGTFSVDTSTSVDAAERAALPTAGATT